MLEGAEVALMCIDDVVPSIHVARKCYEAAIPIVDSVAMPCLNVRVFDTKSVPFEIFYGFGTEKLSIEELHSLSEAELGRLIERLIETFAGVENLLSFYNQGGASRMQEGNFSTFTPMVWMQSAAIALEAVKVLLDWGEISYAPDYAMYDPFTHTMLEPIVPSRNK